eukprot:TRINITY_DN31_c4_g1_i1.p3 TRINITY_DN31_c4_g1~~TRINITY_DN31_c4_g1_i1.p3  ORF type:complete len:177 (-),score=41.19 TRINITY_DN31_c4_g1_i1:23-553(-)
MALGAAAWQVDSWTVLQGTVFGVEGCYVGGSLERYSGGTLQSLALATNVLQLTALTLYVLVPVARCCFAWAGALIGVAAAVTVLRAAALATWAEAQQAILAAGPAHFGLSWYLCLGACVASGLFAWIGLAARRREARKTWHSTSTAAAERTKAPVVMVAVVTEPRAAVHVWVASGE